MEAHAEGLEGRPHPAEVLAHVHPADMMKAATDRFDAAATTLNLSRDQVVAIKPLLQSKYVDTAESSVLRPVDP